MENNILIADYSYQSENETRERQIAFKMIDDHFVEGYGERMKNSTKFKDINKLEFNSNMPLKRLIAHNYERKSTNPTGRISQCLNTRFGHFIKCLAMPVVLSITFNQEDLTSFYGIAAFAVGVLLVYSSSTLYHFVQEQKIKNILKIADHISIYFLIAGTYTPLMIKYLPSSTAFVFLTTMWCIVLFGTLFKIFFIHKFEWFSVILYLAMGWMIVLSLNH